MTSESMAIVGSGNEPVRCQVFNWISGDVLLIARLDTNFIEIFIKIYQILSKKTYFISNADSKMAAFLYSRPRTWL